MFYFAQNLRICFVVTASRISYHGIMNWTYYNPNPIEDGLYVHVAMGCMGGGKWTASIGQSGGTVLYSYTIGTSENTYSDSYQNYCLGIRIVYLTKGETVSSTIGGGASMGSRICKTIKLT